MKRNVPAGAPFFLHTEPLEAGFPHLGNRATIAVAMAGDSIFWGLAICGEGDNFCKSKGRELALERLHNAFGRIENEKGHFDGFETSSQCMMSHAAGIAAKVQKNFNKWKHRINVWQDNLETTNEPVPKDVVAAAEPE